MGGAYRQQVINYLNFGEKKKKKKTLLNLSSFVMLAMIFGKPRPAVRGREGSRGYDKLAGLFKSKQYRSPVVKVPCRVFGPVVSLA